MRKYPSLASHCGVSTTASLGRLSGQFETVNSQACNRISTKECILILYYKGINGALGSEKCQGEQEGLKI